MFAVVTICLFLGVTICNAGVIQEKLYTRFCVRVDRNYIPSELIFNQLKIDSALNGTILNVTPEVHNLSLFLIVWAYLLVGTTLRGNNPINIFIHRFIEQLIHYLSGECYKYDNEFFRGKVNHSHNLSSPI